MVSSALRSARAMSPGSCTPCNEVHPRIRVGTESYKSTWHSGGSCQVRGRQEILPESFESKSRKVYQVSSIRTSPCCSRSHSSKVAWFEISCTPFGVWGYQVPGAQRAKLWLLLVKYLNTWALSKLLLPAARDGMQCRLAPGTKEL